MSTPDRYTYVQWDGVDDYLHQAASSEWWPEGITYDPDSSGTPIGSLGVHEHWNNTTDMEYSKNLGTGDGIELVKLFQIPTSVKENKTDFSLEVFPNPVTTTATIRFHLDPKQPGQAGYLFHGRKTYSNIDKSISSMPVIKILNGIRET